MSVCGRSCVCESCDYKAIAARTPHRRLVPASPRIHHQASTPKKRILTQQARVRFPLRAPFAIFLLVKRLPFRLRIFVDTARTAPFRHLENHRFYESDYLFSAKDSAKDNKHFQNVKKTCQLHGLFSALNNC